MLVAKNVVQLTLFIANQARGATFIDRLLADQGKKPQGARLVSERHTPTRSDRAYPLSEAEIKP